MIDKVLDTITRHSLIEYGDNIVIGISGGPDSVCLFHILHKISQKYNLKLFALHVNHMLRAGDAILDQEYVVKLCRTYGVPLRVIERDITRLSEERGISLEEAGREVRYSFFKELASEVGGGKIAVAHNKNDQVETVLMNIIRGSGLEGLKGIEYKRDNIIRPLLDINRKEIEDYCSENGLKPRIDKTNFQNIYTRNRVRLDLIPGINKAFGVNISESISRLSELAREDNDFIEEIAVDAYKSCSLEKRKLDKSESQEQDNGILIDIGRIKLLHVSIQKRVLRLAIKEVKGELKEIESKHIDLILDLIKNGRTGLEIHLPGRVRVSRSYNEIRIYLFNEVNQINNEGNRKNEKYREAHFNYKVNVPGYTFIKEIDASVQANIKEKIGKSIEEFSNIGYNSLIQFFDYEKIIMGISIRSRKEGDIFKPLKSIGTKKLKEYFIDNKIPREKRSLIPLIAVENEIVWIIGYKISDKFRVTENTNSILKIEVTLRN